MLAQFEAFMQFVCDNNLEISRYHDNGSYGNISQSAFQDIISEYFGQNACYYFSDNRVLTVIDRTTNEEIFSIDGYTGGDWYVGMKISFIPLLFFHNDNVYYKKKLLGHIYSKSQYRFDINEKNLYIIADHSLKKYDSDFNECWNTSLIIKGGRQTTQGMDFVYLDYPNKTYPKNLISIGDKFYIELYSKITGEFYKELKMAFIEK